MKFTTKHIINDAHPNIRKKSQKIEKPYQIEDIQLAKDLFEYVKNSQDEALVKQYNLKGAVGIAAVQVNILKKAFAVLVEDEDGKIHQYALLNPKLVSHSAKKCYLKSGEGCLSVDEVHTGYVPRYFKIQMQAFDCLTMQEVMIHAKGYFAIVLQHEYDHLNGVLFYDHINQKEPLKPIENAIEI